jgi:hypothetical protein
MEGDACALQAERVILTAQRIDFHRVLLHHGDLHLRIAEQGIEQARFIRAEDQSMPPLSPALSSKVCASFDASAGTAASFVRLRFEATETLAAAIHSNATILRHCDELSIRREQVGAPHHSRAVSMSPRVCPSARSR